MSAARAGRGRRLALAGALALLTLGLRAPLFDLPLERDEGEYAYIGWRLLAGDMPYRDWFDQKPPGIFVAYAAALALGGESVAAIRGLAALCCVLSALALFAVVRELRGETEGWLAAVLLAVLSADGAVQGPIANTELFMLPWLLASLWASLRIPARSRPPVGASLAIGALLGMACAFKQVAFVGAPLLLAVFWLRAPRADRTRALVRFTAWTALGGLAVWVAIAAWLAGRGALGAALDAVLLHNLAYSQQVDAGLRLSLLALHTAPMLPSQGVVWALAAIGLAGLCWRRERLPALVLSGLLATSALGVSVSGLYFPHYFQQLLPPLAALAAAAISLLAGALPSGLRWPAWITAVVLALGPPALALLGLARADPAEATRRLYPGSPFEAMPAIGAEVAALTGPEDRVFVFGAEPEILFYARRLSASRYIYLFPLYGDFPEAGERQAEVIAEVEGARPNVIVWIPNQMLTRPGSPQRLTEWTLRSVDRAYRLHAWVSAQGGSRGVLTRLAPGDDPLARLAEASPWATIFVRAAGRAAPGAVSP